MKIENLPVFSSVDFVFSFVLCTLTCSSVFSFSKVELDNEFILLLHSDLQKRRQILIAINLDQKLRKWTNHKIYNEKV